MKPYLIIDWNDTQSEAKGWLVVFNLVKGYAGGGIRMHPTVTKEEVIRLAECMAYKYKACRSSFCGGCKGGIAYDANAGDAKEVLRRYIIAMMPYIQVGLSLGGDYGTKYSDILEIFHELGLDMPLTKSMRKDPQIMMNMAAYQEILECQVYGSPLGDIIAGYGVACSADEAFALLKLERKQADIVIQGMGRVAFGCANRLKELGHKVVGMSDSKVYIYCPQGLDIFYLQQLKKEDKDLDLKKLPDDYQIKDSKECIKESCDILIPAALANTINGENADSLQTKILVEAANIAVSTEGDAILQEKGIYLICDYTANLSEAWLYDAIFFGTVEPVLEKVLKGAEELCRNNADMQMDYAINKGVYARASTKFIFAPDVQDLPEV